MALSWFADQRRRWEPLLLPRYHEALQEHGVTGYSRDHDWDYRFAVFVHLFTPVVQAAGGVVGPGVWAYNLERILAAFDDLNCEELLT